VADPAPATPRAREIVAAATRILEENGREALTMRRLGEAIGIRAPSLYKHFPDKTAVEVALINDGFEAIAAAFETAITENGESLEALAAAYRTFARARPHLYRLMTTGPLPRERLRAGVEALAAAPVLRVTGDPDLARAAWAFAHGMTILELDGRFPPGADLDAAWAAGIAGFASHRREPHWNAVEPAPD
jgi:AcrR family transcriptional regulator